MRYGVTLPTGVEPRALVDLGREAEEADWDGVFLWDVGMAENAWVVLAGIAAVTERVRLGTMLTPPARRRPWELAQETATLDRLSHGRLILAVGMGAAGAEHPNSGWERLGIETSRRARAQMLDESLTLLEAFWSGEPVEHPGPHFPVHGTQLLVRPVQQPRIPIWVVGAWPRERSMRRVVRYDGLLPARMLPDGTHATSNTDGTHINSHPEDLQAMRSYIEERRSTPPAHRAPAGPSPVRGREETVEAPLAQAHIEGSGSQLNPFDIVIEGGTPGDDPARGAQIIAPYAVAGATWWLENVWHTPQSEGGIEGMRTRIREGPPKPGR